MRVVIANAWQGHKPGDVVDLPGRVARRLCGNGWARPAPSWLPIEPGDVDLIEIANEPD